MLTTAEPISSIAIKCGMCDQAHLTRTFRRRVGETPHTWRRARAASCELTSDET
jgi:AraC-like DNA-binding protein